MPCSSGCPKLVAELGKYRGQLLDVNSDLQQNGLQTYLGIHRMTAARYGFQPNQIDNVLYDAFGQRTVSTIYNPLNQYFVVMEVAPQYWQYPQTLDQIFLSTAAGNPSGTQQTQMPGRHRQRAPADHGRDHGAECRGQHQRAERECASQSTDQQHLQQQGRAVRAAAPTAPRRRGRWCRCWRWASYANSHTATQVNHQSGPSWPGPSRSTCRAAARSAKPLRSFRKPSATSTCRPRSTAPSPARRRSSRSRWAPCRC